MKAPTAKLKNALKFWKCCDLPHRTNFRLNLFENLRARVDKIEYIIKYFNLGWLQFAWTNLNTNNSEWNRNSKCFRFVWFSSSVFAIIEFKPSNFVSFVRVPGTEIHDTKKTKKFYQKLPIFRYRTSFDRFLFEGSRKLLNLWRIHFIKWICVSIAFLCPLFLSFYFYCWTITTE